MSWMIVVDFGGVLLSGDVFWNRLGDRWEIVDIVVGCG